MSKTSLIIIIVFTSIAIVLTSLTLKVLPTPNQKKAISTPKPIASPQVVPFNTNSKFVRGAQINYQFNLNFDKLVPSQTDSELLVNPKNIGLPTFIITKETKIASLSNGKESPASLTGLKPNQKLIVYSQYNLKKKSWVTNKVVIDLTPNKVATPSATPKK